MGYLQRVSEASIPDWWRDDAVFHEALVQDLQRRDNTSAVVAAYAELLGRFSWEWFLTHTFCDNPAPEAAIKRYRYWLGSLEKDHLGRGRRGRGDGFRWVRALERTKRGIVHFHVLLGYTRGLRMVKARKRWQALTGGFVRVERPRSGVDVAKYCSKYTTKGGEIDVGGPGWSDSLEWRQ